MVLEGGILELITNVFVRSGDSHQINGLILILNVAFAHYILEVVSVAIDNVLHARQTDESAYIVGARHRLQQMMLLVNLFERLSQLRELFFLLISN